MSNTQWNGEPCTALRVTVTVADSGAFPEYWAREFVGTRRKAVEVEYGGETFYLDDEDGSGWNKVTHGGSPHWTHSNLTVEPDSVEPRVTELGSTPPAAQGLPPGALDSATDGGAMLDASARTPNGRNLLAHALQQLARDGWLRTEPGAAEAAVARASALAECVYENPDNCTLHASADGPGLAATECSAQYYKPNTGPARECIRAAQHRGDHIDEHGFHWSDSVAVYPVVDGQPCESLGYCGNDCPPDPDRPCPHENFDAVVEVNRFTASETDPAIVAYLADIKVNCHDCGEPFRWTGVQAGMSQRQPMCSVDETELRAPLRPASADPDFGLGLPGFAVTYRGPAASPCEQHPNAPVIGGMCGGCTVYPTDKEQ